MGGLEFINKAFAAYASDIFVKGTRVWLKVPEGVVDARSLPNVRPEELKAFVETINHPSFLPRSREGGGKEYTRDYAANLPTADPNLQIRMRIHAFYTRGEQAFAIRLIPPTAKSLVDLGFESGIEERVKGARGLFLVTGNTGAGKTTTVSALAQRIVLESPVHLLTLEDPVEYIVTPGRGMVSQKELHTDFPSFPEGLRASLRESPDVVLVGEVRDLETLRWTLTLAEAGLLVLATFHARSPQEAVERIVGSFPQEEQNQAKTRLATTLVGILSQTLLPAQGPQGRGRRRVVAYEYLFADSAVRTVIKEDKTQTLPNLISTLASKGMGARYEDSLARLLRLGLIRKEQALSVASDPKLLEGKLRQDG